MPGDRLRRFAKGKCATSRRTPSASYGSSFARGASADTSFAAKCRFGPYIADFVCFEQRLIVEADGSQHADNAQDAERDAWFASQGLSHPAVLGTRIS